MPDHSACDAPAPQPPPGDDVDLVLPQALYAATGVTTGIHFDHLTAEPQPGRLRMTVTCALGLNRAEQWSVTPTPQQAGVHRLLMTAHDEHGRLVAEHSSQLVVSGDDVSRQPPLRLAFVGDSLTGVGNGYPTCLARLLSTPGHPAWRLLGSRVSEKWPQIRTEGYPGWRWRDFLTRYEAESDPAQKRFTSPFLFAQRDGGTRLDVGRWVDQVCPAGGPDVVFFFLGANDVTPIYHASNGGQNAAAMDQGIKQMLREADTLLAAFRRALPQAALAVALTSPGNRRAAAYDDNYKGELRREGCKRVQHRMVRRMIEHLGEQEDQNLFLVPTHLWIDPEHGFPPNNAIHPNDLGHEQLAASFYAWLRHWLHRHRTPGLEQGDRT